jgi:hypothetical protein
MQHPDEGMIHTWLDGELPADEAAALEAHVAGCAECKAAVAEARGFIAASSRIAGALDNVPAGVIPIAKPAAPVKRVWYSSPQFRAAAAVIVVAGASLLVMRTGTQKATLSGTVKPEASEAATQRTMAASNSALAMDSAEVKPPVVAQQSVRKEQAVKPAVAVPKGPQVVAAPVVAADAAKLSPVESQALNKAGFAGVQTRGGTANGVAGASALTGNVAGVAANAADAIKLRSAMGISSLPPRILRVDSSVFFKRTTYQTASGKEAVLTEQRIETELNQVVVTGIAVPTSEASRKAAPKSSPNPAPTQAPSPVTAAAPPVPAQAPPAADSTLTIHTIRWSDPATQRRYTLSGPLSVAELEALKAQLLQARH